MSVISDSFSSIGVSYKDEEIELKKKFIDCLGETCEEEEEIFDDIYNAPEELQKYSEMKFLCVESFFQYEKCEDIFLLLDKLFPETYLFQADDWDKDFVGSDDDWDEEEDEGDEENEDDWDDEAEDESGEVFGDKTLTFFDSKDMTKYKYALSFHEVLDMDGGSNGADVDFKADEEVVKEKITKVAPDAALVEEILGKAAEKDYQDLVDLIKKIVN